MKRQKTTMNSMGNTLNELSDYPDLESLRIKSVENNRDDTERKTT